MEGPIFPDIATLYFFWPLKHASPRKASFVTLKHAKNWPSLRMLYLKHCLPVEHRDKVQISYVKWFSKHIKWQMLGKDTFTNTVVKLLWTQKSYWVPLWYPDPALTHLGLRADSLREQHLPHCCWGFLLTSWDSRIHCWLFPGIDLLPGKSIGSQGHTITTITVVLIKRTTT